MNRPTCTFLVEWAQCVRDPGHDGPHRNHRGEKRHQACEKVPPAAIRATLPRDVEARCDRFARHPGPCGFTDHTGRRRLFTPERAAGAS